MQLYELTRGMGDLFTALDEANSPDIDEAEEVRIKLDLLAGQFEFKAEQIGKMILNLAADANQCEKEERRLARKRQVTQNRIGHLENYLLNNMNTLGITKVKGDVFNISVRDNPYSVVGAVDLLKLPETFTRIVPEHREPDKVKILAHFKDTGEVVLGVPEIKRSQRVEIK